MALYSEGRVKKLVIRLKEEYDRALKSQREVSASLKEENRALKARVLLLEGERKEVADALVLAVKERKRAEAAAGQEEKNGQAELRLLAAKCRALAEHLLEKYPEEDGAATLLAHADDLSEEMGEPVSTGFNMEEVIAPKQPLDLAKLCRSLGVMEEE